MATEDEILDEMGQAVAEAQLHPRRMVQKWSDGLRPFARRLADAERERDRMKPNVWHPDDRKLVLEERDRAIAERDSLQREVATLQQNLLDSNEVRLAAQREVERLRQRTSYTDESVKLGRAAAEIRDTLGAKIGPVFEQAGTCRVHLPLAVVREAKRVIEAQSALLIDVKEEARGSGPPAPTDPSPITLNLVAQAVLSVASWQTRHERIEHSLPCEGDQTKWSGPLGDLARALERK